MKEKIKSIIKIIIKAQKIESAFALACAAYSVYTLIPKYEKISGIDTEKLIENVNSKHIERSERMNNGI